MKGLVAALATLTAAGATAHKPSIALNAPLPSVVRIGQQVTVRGRVHGARHGRAILESSRGHGWTALSMDRVGSRGGAFEISWTVPSGTAIGPLSLRVVLVQATRLLAATATAHSAVGSAVVHCATPAPPSNVPAGDGWIEGGMYIIGGAYPGLDQCSSQPYTVTATDSAGHIAATEPVPADGSYTLVVPAGNYTLQAGGCRGSATVTSGQGTAADTNCLVP